MSIFNRGENALDRNMYESAEACRLNNGIQGKLEYLRAPIFSTYSFSDTHGELITTQERQNFSDCEKGLPMDTWNRLPHRQISLNIQYPHIPNLSFETFVVILNSARNDKEGEIIRPMLRVTNGIHHALPQQAYDLPHATSDQLKILHDHFTQGASLPFIHTFARVNTPEVVLRALGAISPSLHEAFQEPASSYTFTKGVRRMMKEQPILAKKILEGALDKNALHSEEWINYFRSLPLRDFFELFQTHADSLPVDIQDQIIPFISEQSRDIGEIKGIGKVATLGGLFVLTKSLDLRLGNQFPTESEFLEAVSCISAGISVLGPIMLFIARQQGKKLDMLLSNLNSMLVHKTNVTTRNNQRPK